MADTGLRAALLETIGGLMATDQVVWSTMILLAQWSSRVDRGQEWNLNRTQVARSRAEEQVKALEVTDEFGLHLAELTLQVFTFRIELTLQVFTQLSLPYRVSSWKFPTLFWCYPGQTVCCQLWFSLQRDGALPVRQLASVLLKQYIDVHWSPDAARWRPLKPSPLALIF